MTTLSPRWKRAIAIVGALVVLSSFIVKEVLGERIHSKLEGIASAIREFSSETQSDQLSTEILALEEKYDQSTARMRVKRTEQIDVADITVRENLDLTGTVLRRARSLSASSKRLVSTLPGSNDLMVLLAAADKELNDLDEKIKALGQRALEFFLDDVDFESPNDPDSKKAAAEGYAIRNSLVGLRGRVIECNSRLADARERILEAATSYRERTEAVSKKWTLISYALFAFGWTVGLVGSLLGESKHENSE